MLPRGADSKVNRRARLQCASHVHLRPHGTPSGRADATTPRRPGHSQPNRCEAVTAPGILLAVLGRSAQATD